MAESLTAELTGRAEESLRGPLKVEIHDNLGDGFMVCGQVPGEIHDSYPDFDQARHQVRAAAIERIPDFVSLLLLAEELAANWESTESLEYRVWRGIHDLFDELNRIGEENERANPRETPEMRGEGFIDDTDAETA